MSLLSGKKISTVVRNPRVRKELVRRELNSIQVSDIDDTFNFPMEKGSIKRKDNVEVMSTGMTDSDSSHCHQIMSVNLNNIQMSYSNSCKL